MSPALVSVTFKWAEAEAAGAKRERRGARANNQVVVVSVVSVVSCRVVSFRSRFLGRRRPSVRVARAATRWAHGG